MIRIGDHNFISKEALEAALKSRLLMEYDFSAKAREKHDAEAVYFNGKKIKLTEEERHIEITRIRNIPAREDRPIKKGSEVPNIWIKG